MTEAELGPDWLRRPVFWRNVARVEGTLADRPGFIGHAERTELFGARACTMTVWTDDAADQAATLDARYVWSTVHGLASPLQTDAAKTLDLAKTLNLAKTLDLDAAVDDALAQHAITRICTGLRALSASPD